MRERRVKTPHSVPRTKEGTSLERVERGPPRANFVGLLMIERRKKEATNELGIG